MHTTFSFMARTFVLSCALFLSACAGYGGSNLKPGVDTVPAVIASMGEPAMRWKEADGREQLAYPRGPAGTQTFMVFMGADGRLQRIEQVLDSEYFARIEHGKSTMSDVLKVLGPSPSQWVSYFKARDELVWSWRFCDSWSFMAFFDVMFDASTGVVRSTSQRPDLSGPDGVAPRCGR